MKAGLPSSRSQLPTARSCGKALGASTKSDIPPSIGALTVPQVCNVIVQVDKRENSQRDCDQSHESAIFPSEATLRHFHFLPSHSIHRPCRISCRSHLHGTEKNKIRLSQTLRMGLGAVSTLFY